MAERRFSANISTIGKAGQLKLSRACIGVAGLGGVGGIAFELLVRAGVGKIKIADSGFFEESNANRQSLWTYGNDGMKKTEAATDFARQVNKACRVFPFGEITAHGAAGFASGCAAVIDATDRKRSRIAVWRGCREMRVPYVFASALGQRGMLSVFWGRDFEKEFALSGKRGGEFLSCDHSLGPVANAVGCLSAQQALNIVLGKKAAQFPSLVSIDAFSSEQAATCSF
ncbi:SAMP-activating enzyme E1 [uncultured archaeon]|nr:SAMP-activating enzyme E1 [uncultured archaeon]